MSKVGPASWDLTLDLRGHNGLHIEVEQKIVCLEEKKKLWLMADKET